MVTVLMRAEMLDRYNRAHQKLVAVLVKCPRIMWDFKPSAELWSIREILIHLADSEAHAYIRARRIVAEPGQDVIAFDQDIWARQLDYASQDPDDALDLFRLARKLTTALLRRQPDSAWSQTTIHPERGPITLDDWLEIFTLHAEAHLDQIQRVHQAWQNQNTNQIRRLTEQQAQQQ